MSAIEPVYAVSIVHPYYGRGNYGGRPKKQRARKIHKQDCTVLGQIELLRSEDIPEDAEPCKICKPTIKREG